MAKRQTLNDKERAYQQAVRDAFQQWARDERQYIASLKDNLNAYRNQILADLPEEGTWAAHRRQQTIEMLDDAKATLDGQLSRSIVGASNQAINTALFSVEAPLSAFGMNLANISRQLPLEQIGFLQRAAPSLITNVSTQVHNDVGSLLQRYMAGGIRRQDLIRQIGAATGPLPGATMKPGQIIPRAEMRAQTIVRTEINATSSLVQQHRIEELSNADKGVGSRWVHFPSRNPRPTHEALHGVTIFPGHGERFELSGVKITGPHDPALGAEDRISCHCKVSTVYDPTRSEAETDVHVGAATGSAAAAEPTPKVPEPKAKPVAKAKKAPKPKAPKKPATAFGDFADLPQRPAVGATRAENIQHIRDLLDVDLPNYKAVGWQVDMSYTRNSDAFFKKMDDDAVRGYAHALHDIAENARSRQIPMWHTIGKTRSRSATVLADCGGGGLGVSPNMNTLMEDFGRMVGDADYAAFSKSKAIESLMSVRARAAKMHGSKAIVGEIDGWLDDLAKWDGRGVSPVPMYKSTVGDSALWRATNASGRLDKQVSAWQPSYFSSGTVAGDDAVSSLWHEYGHHVHQWTHKKREQWSVNMIEEALKRELDLNRHGDGFISKYANVGGKAYSGGKEQNGVEWFAENFAAWSRGWKNLCEPEWIEFATKHGVI